MRKIQPQTNNTTYFGVNVHEAKVEKRSVWKAKSGNCFYRRQRPARMKCMVGHALLMSHFKYFYISCIISVTFVTLRDICLFVSDGVKGEVFRHQPLYWLSTGLVIKFKGEPHVRIAQRTTWSAFWALTPKLHQETPPPTLDPLQFCNITGTLLDPEPPGTMK